MAARCTPISAQILIIDDDRFVRDFAVDAIEFSTNRKVVTFDSGFHAWQYIQSRPKLIDIVIADANIPDLRGLELLERTKLNHPEKIFILASSNPEHEKAAYQMGADAFLFKPFDANDLFTIVERLVLSPPSLPKVKIGSLGHHEPIG